MEPEGRCHQGKRENRPGSSGVGKIGQARGMHRQTSRLPDQRARKEDDMMGGKQGSVSGVGAEGSDQELPSAGAPGHPAGKFGFDRIAFT